MLKDLYKKQSLDLVGRQEERRRRLLEIQKQKRHLAQDNAREIIDPSEPPPNKSLKKTRCRFKFFKDLYKCEWSLQLSEWMREKPDDLTEWFLLPCPRGQRCMVVAHNGYTEMFSKNGRRCFGFRSVLPGDRQHSNYLTILDCIYEKSLETFFVLDALSYGNQELRECDAKFRFFWLKSKFEETTDLREVSEFNEKSFQLLEHYDFEDWESIIEVLQKYPLWPDNRPPLDGFLFYHKDASYHFGSTPLVCWLFPFMIYDVLNLLISTQYEKPIEYLNPIQYIDLYESLQNQKQKAKALKPNNGMDCDTNPNDESNMEADSDPEMSSLNSLLLEQRELEMQLDDPVDFKSEI